MTYYVNAYAVIFDNDDWEDDESTVYQNETQFVMMDDDVGGSFTHDLDHAKAKCARMLSLYPEQNYRVVKITMEEIL